MAKIAPYLVQIANLEKFWISRTGAEPAALK
jgi:hypothetical protein